LTIKYSYKEDTPVENIVTSVPTGVIYNILGQKMPTTNFNDLPKGVYIINGKKYIKQQ
jgi:hypothetical protein